MDGPQHTVEHARNPAALAAATPLPPTPPPRPQAHPSPATERALSLEHVVLRVLSHLDSIHFEDEHQHDPAHATNTDLVACALVAPLWRVIARDLLNEHLIFTKGTTVRKWLDGLGDDGIPRSPTRSLSLRDDLPFKPSSRDGDGAKWSYADIALLFAKVKGLDHLEIMFVRQDEIPGDLLTHENLASVTYLALGCPVSKPTKPLPFRLAAVQLFDPSSEDERLDRDWTSTAILLGTSPALANLRYLRLETFPRAAEYLARMFRLAPRIKNLCLSVLRDEPNLWQVHLFATLCTSLVSLHVEHLLDTGPRVLTSFLTGPPSVNIGNVRGTVGHDHPFVLQALVPPCPVDELFKALRRCRPGSIRRVTFRRIALASYDYEADFIQLHDMCGIRFNGTLVSAMTKNDWAYLDHLVRQSQADPRWQEQHPRQEVDEVA
ncbi:uncharacterized protein RHOBADRAFT_47430 [Rhodotorula graminis WP1]|uniref:F-box domain-containing protein n=1 Tax=Rhodotorula graminis (strain WP1) TaxID=578459 RepID=A0A0P9EQE7_RHOGW|nr:uncharacterized protein RHOBADRAFT_47430 [Rhodotorula graminis WP1]KPV71726.1 hypothetical protein RHOBADRAFT_47430 [Rhodotorula graminis WP1]